MICLLKRRNQYLESKVLWQYRGQIEQLLLGLLSFGLAIPFIEQAIPVNLPIIPFTLVPIAIYVVLLSSYESYRRVFRMDVFTVILTCVLLVYLIAASRTDVAFLSSVWITFIYGLYYTLLAVLIGTFFDHKRTYPVIINYLYLFISSVAVLAALIGLYKYLAYKNGLTFEFVAKASSGTYPYGTTLLSDYNFYGLTLLIGSLFLLRYWMHAKSFGAGVLFAALCSVVITAGIYSGSRRFIILVPLLLLTTLIIRGFIFRGEESPLRWASLATGSLIALVLVFLFFVHFNGAYDRHLEVQVMTLGALDHGMSSRLERWSYALELIANIDIWQINDFQYRKDYGCKFVNCIDDDYPHAPILSSVLYGGIYGLLSTLLFYLYLTYLAFKLVRLREYALEVALALVAVALYTAISGDTLFSVPALIVIMIVARVAIDSASLSE